jgi:hypothetical protein
MYQHKIYGSDRDLLGIVLFGTEKNNTNEDFPHIFMLQVNTLRRKKYEIKLFNKELNDNYNNILLISNQLKGFRTTECRKNKRN